MVTVSGCEGAPLAIAGEIDARITANAKEARMEMRFDRVGVDVCFMAGWNGVFRLKDSVFRFFTA